MREGEAREAALGLLVEANESKKTQPTASAMTKQKRRRLSARPPATHLEDEDAPPSRAGDIVSGRPPPPVEALRGLRGAVMAARRGKGERQGLETRQGIREGKRKKEPKPQRLLIEKVL